MMKRESKTAEWRRVSRQLKVEFQAMGITACELRLEGCWRNDWISFAHAVKRNAIRRDAERTDPESIWYVILCCVPCHQQIERLPKPEMRAAVIRVVEARTDRHGAAAGA